MPSMQTLFRAVVMVVVGVVAVKAWKLYGPTNEQVKSTFTQVVETVQSTLQSWRQPTANTPPIAQAPPAAPPVVSSTPAEAPKLLPQSATPSAPLGTPLTATPAEQMLTSPGASGDRMQELLARLQQLGASGTSLTPWGNPGNQYYRFTCQAPLVNVPTMTQHFEAIATEPAEAVQDVLTKVESWKIAQRESANRRY